MKLDGFRHTNNILMLGVRTVSFKIGKKCNLNYLNYSSIFIHDEKV